MNDSTEIARSIAATHKNVPGGLMPALHGIQDALGHIPKESVAAIASEFNLSRAEVHGVITYYHHFRSEPAGKHVVHICRAEACQSMGADALLAHASKTLGCSVHGTSADGVFTLEPAYCLGMCASSPAALIDDELHARLTPQSFDELVAQARSAT